MYRQMSSNGRADGLLRVNCIIAGVYMIELEVAGMRDRRSV